MLKDQLLGQTVSHYKIIEHLGGGGMGIVYKAEDIKLKRIVALKFLPADFTQDPQAKARFMHEAQAASALDHPRIGTIYEINETDDGHMFIAMAYYEGQTLAQKMASESISPQEAIEIVSHVAYGLMTAHEKGIVHRDIKPANIIITDDGFIKIVDFGLAKLGGATRITKEGTSMGTPAYMSPEQVKGLEVDHRSDIWSLGLILYEMLAGRLPFRGDNEMTLLYNIVNEEPLPIAQFNTKVPVHLESVIAQAMAKKPADRYGSMKAMLEDLTQLLQAWPTDDPQVTKTIISGDLPLAVATAPTADVTKTIFKPAEATKTVVAPQETVVIPSATEEPKPRRSTKLIVSLVVLAGLIAVAVLNIDRLPFLLKDERLSSEATPTQETQLPDNQPVSASITIHSDPPGAIILLNGEDSGQTTPATLAGLAIGNYEIGLQKSGYEAQKKAFSIGSGEPLEWSTQLEQIASTRTQQPAVKTEAAKEKPKLGDDQTKVTKATADESNKERQKTPPEAQESRKPEVLPPSQPGQLTILAISLELNTEVQKFGATFFINGQEHGQTPKMVELDTGSYTISGRLFGYSLKEEKVVKIESGKDQTVKLEFLKNN